MASRVPRIISSPHFWVLLSMFAIGTVVHYPQQILGIESPTLFAFVHLERHALERILFLLPITYAGLVFGIRGGLLTMVLSLFVMMPRVFMVSEYVRDALLETVGIAVIGLMVNVGFESYRIERENRQ